jgi:hypothetical protein
MESNDLQCVAVLINDVGVLRIAGQLSFFALFARRRLGREISWSSERVTLASIKCYINCAYFLLYPSFSSKKMSLRRLVVVLLTTSRVYGTVDFTKYVDPLVGTEGAIAGVSIFTSIYCPNHLKA